ncbi:MAG TPA: proteinase inhibitor i78 [Caulobacteraceae bacterium]|nr:proteinase inhibitor i78 [Caulobacteraceae bacterium]
MAKGSLRRGLGARTGGVWAAAGLIATVAACTEPAKPPPAPPPAAEAPPPPPPVVAPPQALGASDTCGADPLQYLVGKPHTDIPVPVNPGLRRVVCSSCAVTQEFNAARQTIVYDSQTGLVRSVKCG